MSPDNTNCFGAGLSDGLCDDLHGRASRDEFARDGSHGVLLDGARGDPFSSSQVHRSQGHVCDPNQILNHKYRHTGVALVYETIRELHGNHVLVSDGRTNHGVDRHLFQLLHDHGKLHASKHREALGGTLRIPYVLWVDLQRNEHLR